MSRPLRIEYEGAWYHVMNRGADRRRVFKTDSQRGYFLSLLGETGERFNAEWHAYCLMGNHYHLMVRTPEGNLQRIMRHVNGLYTQYFNRGEGRDGALFRGRYKAIVVDAEAYWLELSRYIHRNPLEAHLVTDLAAYLWSSYRAYCGLEKPPEWLTTRYILDAIGQKSRHRRYATFVAGETAEALVAFYGKAKLSPILGDEEFRTQVLAGRAPQIDIPELKSARALPSLEEMVAATARHFGVDETEIWTSKRGRGVVSPAGSVAMYVCQKVGDMRLGLERPRSRPASIRSARHTPRSPSRYAAKAFALVDRT
jgi:putative transposase